MRDGVEEDRGRFLSSRRRTLIRPPFEVRTECRVSVPCGRRRTRTERRTLLREDPPCAWRENGRRPVYLSGLRYGVDAHNTATSRPSCSGLREGRSSRAFDTATRAYASVPCRALGIFAAARLGPRVRRLVGDATELRARIADPPRRCHRADRTDPLTRR